MGKRILAYLDQDGARPKDTSGTRRHLSFHDRDGGYELAGWLDRKAAEIVRSALSPLAAPRPTTDTEVDLRNAAQRDADALIELAQRAVGSGELPTEGGERPQVVVTVSLPVLQGRIGSASLALGGPVNADIARRIACDAQLIPVVLGSRELTRIRHSGRLLPTPRSWRYRAGRRGCRSPGGRCRPVARVSGSAQWPSRSKLCSATTATHPPDSAPTGSK